MAGYASSSRHDVCDQDPVGVAGLPGDDHALADAGMLRKTASIS